LPRLIKNRERLAPKSKNRQERKRGRRRQWRELRYQSGFEAVIQGAPIARPEGGVANSRRIGQLLRCSDEVDVPIFALEGGVPMDVSSLVTSETGAMWLLRLARSLPIDATPLCMTSVRSATQYRRIRSLIQIEAQTYRILPIIPNTTPTFLVQRANGAVQKIVVHGLVIKAAKDCPASTLTKIAVKT